jgi:uncharacterized Zn-finger protein
MFDQKPVEVSHLNSHTSEVDRSKNRKSCLKKFVRLLPTTFLVVLVEEAMGVIGGDN